MNKEEYIKQNNLQQSYITKQTLWQCRPLLPEVKEVGQKQGHKVFFEETSGSLQKRHYGKSDKATSFNLLINDGIETRKITKEEIDDIIITGDYDAEKLKFFVDNTSKRFNPLSERQRTKQYWFNLTIDEYYIVKDFIKKMRAYYENN